MTSAPAQPVPSLAESVGVVTLVRRAARILPSTWPLETFIAVNPLAGFEHLPFEEASARSLELFGARGALSEADFQRLMAEGRISVADLARSARSALGDLADEVVGQRADGAPVTGTDLLVTDLLYGPPAPPSERVAHTLAQRCDRLFGTSIAAAVDEEAARWTTAYLDDGTTAWDIPTRGAGLYAGWKSLALLDRRLPRPVRSRLVDQPADAGRALFGVLQVTGFSQSGQLAFLEGQLASLPGWAAYINGQSGELLVEYLALRAVLEHAFVDSAVGWVTCLNAVTSARTDDGLDTDPIGGPARLDAAVDGAGVERAGASVAELDSCTRVLAAVPVGHRQWVWLNAYEQGYRSALLALLPRQEATVPGESARHAVVMCIDPRSEGLRRHIEVDGVVETFGFAGFFAVAMAYRDVAGGEASPQCPVLLEPRFSVDERPDQGAVEQVARQLRGRRLEAGGHDGFHGAKDDFLGPFALAEAGGWIAAPLSAGRTFAPRSYQRLRSFVHRWVAPPAATELVPEPGITFDEQLLFARVLLASTGLHRTSATLILLCGHGSTTENNPYRSALDCGACGGHRGAPNARIAATILNRSEIREALAADGIELTKDVWFVAGEHDTATDEVTLLDVHLVPEAFSDDLTDLSIRLDGAGRSLVEERSLTLPGTRRGSGVVRSVRSRSADWAQVMPEWGLAGNAAFIVGPRAMTVGVDLGRRVFLHSYDAAADSVGDALETILTAPMVVAQWINCQYYFSSVAPDVFGAGTKTVHNVAGGGVGVVAGPEGDLLLGLPWQSVGLGDRLVHEPLRLLTVIQAPLERIDAVVNRNQILRELFGNGWVAVAARQDEQSPWMARTRAGGWTPWDGTDRDGTDRDDTNPTKGTL
jgi:uncharacterized protein YbcC (UPF0753/DUF2309 family)